eukprot:m.274489 g.274489  ORF g.274489 m.274489 type:complete len:457 (-) comp16288_c2_seq2:109-1479(-)
MENIEDATNSFKKIPGSSGFFLYSDYSLTFYRDPMHFVQGLVSEHGPIVKSRILNKATVFITSNGLTKELLDGPNASNFSCPKAYSPFMSAVYGENALLASGERHNQLRDLFHNSIISATSAQGRTASEKPDSQFHAELEAIYNSVSEEMTSLKDQEVNLYQCMKQLASRAIFTLFLGLDACKDKAKEEQKELERVTTAHWHGLISMPVNLSVPGVKGSMSGRAKSMEAAAKLREKIQQWQELGSCEGGRSLPSITSALFSHMNKVDATQATLLSISALVTKALAAMLTYMCIELFLSGDNGREHAKRAREDDEYLDWVILEVERVYPPFFAGRRIAMKKTSLGGYEIPEGSAVMFVIPIANQDESVFQDAHKFIPERWSQKQNSSLKIGNTYTYGCGPRECIGKYVMRPLLKSLAKGILKKHSLKKLGTGALSAPKWLPVMRPDVPVLVSVETLK